MKLKEPKSSSSKDQEDDDWKVKALNEPMRFLSHVSVAPFEKGQVRKKKTPRSHKQIGIAPTAGNAADWLVLAQFFFGEEKKCWQVKEFVTLVRREIYYWVKQTKNCMEKEEIFIKPFPSNCVKKFYNDVSAIEWTTAAAGGTHLGKKSFRDCVVVVDGWKRIHIMCVCMHS